MLVATTKFGYYKLRFEVAAAQKTCATAVRKASTGVPQASA